jgi:hypothetical protein
MSHLPSVYVFIFRIMRILFKNTTNRFLDINGGEEFRFCHNFGQYSFKLDHYNSIMRPGY